MRVARLRAVNLPPDVFAIVMATGICSDAAHAHGYRWLSVVLDVLAGIAFAALALGLAVRLAVGFGEVVAQGRDPDVALRMFTSVAACEVLGLRWAGSSVVLGCALGLVVVGWLMLGPLAVADVRARPRTELRDHAHGAWLLPSVAASGLAALAATAARPFGDWLLGPAVAMWLFGLLVYIAVALLILGRARAGRMFADPNSEPVPPDSWILMGALAAATLAGTRIGAAAFGDAWLTDGTRVITMATWIVASLWLPVLLYAEVWQVNRQTGALHYAGVWWSAVFPLGMYSTATAACATFFHLPALVTISLVFFWVAFTVWLMVAAGYARGHLRIPVARTEDRISRTR